MTKRFLIPGDALAFLILTIIGFVSHGETDASYLPRAAAMFGSYAAGWFILAPALGLFEAERLRGTRQLWRVALTAFFAAQFSAILRGLILQSDVPPLFAVILGLTSALIMVVWRAIAGRLLRRAG